MVADGPHLFFHGVEILSHDDVVVDIYRFEFDPVIVGDVRCEEVEEGAHECVDDGYEEEGEVYLCEYSFDLDVEV